MNTEIAEPDHNQETALQEGLLRDPIPGETNLPESAQLLPEADWQKFRRELEENKDPSFQERARQVLLKLRNTLGFNQGIQTTEPKPLGGTTRGSKENQIAL